MVQVYHRELVHPRGVAGTLTARVRQVLLPPVVVLALGACTPDIGVDPVPVAMVFDPTATPPRAPEPSHAIAMMLETGRPIALREAIIAWISDVFTSQTSVHHGHCHEITIDSETEAHGVIAMEDYIRGLDRKTKLLHAAGHYWETYRYEEGAWRIATTKLTRLFSDMAMDQFYASGVDEPQVAAE